MRQFKCLFQDPGLAVSVFVMLVFRCAGVCLVFNSMCPLNYKLPKGQVHPDLCLTMSHSPSSVCGREGDGPRGLEVGPRQGGQVCNVNAM